MEIKDWKKEWEDKTDGVYFSKSDAKAFIRTLANELLDNINVRNIVQDKGNLERTNIYYEARKEIIEELQDKINSLRNYFK